MSFADRHFEWILAAAPAGESPGCTRWHHPRDYHWSDPRVGQRGGGRAGRASDLRAVPWAGPHRPHVPLLWGDLWWPDTGHPVPHPRVVGSRDDRYRGLRTGQTGTGRSGVGVRPSLLGHRFRNRGDCPEHAHPAPRPVCPQLQSSGILRPWGARVKHDLGLDLPICRQGTHRRSAGTPFRHRRDRRRNGHPSLYVRLEHPHGRDRLYSRRDRPVCGVGSVQTSGTGIPHQRGYPVRGGGAHPRPSPELA